MTTDRLARLADRDELFDDDGGWILLSVDERDALVEIAHRYFKMTDAAERVCDEFEHGEVTDGSYALLSEPLHAIQRRVSVSRGHKYDACECGNGGRRDHPAGYVELLMPGYRGRVMEEHLGRRLTADEHIHHVNGDPRDNRIEKPLHPDEL